jgi:predicted small secreted protein
MKKVLLVIALVLVIALPLSAANYSKTNGIGVGVSGGYPVSGVAVKYGMDDFRLVGTLGYSFASAFALEAGAQYDVTEFDIDGIPFYVNVGVTGAISIGGDFGLSVNVPVGVSYFFEDFPVEVFLKLGPGVKILPSVAFDFGGALGGLYYLD